jgi:hypothetical protein
VPGRRILANLDVEEDLRGSFGGGGPARTLSAPARRAAATAATRLRVFAVAGDRLWLPAEPDPGGPEVPRGAEGLPEPIVEIGPPEALAPVRQVLAWGEGPRVATLRARWLAGGGAAVDEPRALREPLHEAVWHLVPAAPEVVARVADRAFGLEIAREHGWALPGARWVADVAEIERHLASGGAATGAGRWVVKAPYSAAGRERHVAAGPGELAEPPVRRRIESLLARHGRLLFEPWVERTADFGAAGLLTAAGVRLASLHRQEVGARGAFRGIAPVPAGEGAAGLAPAERDLLEAAFHATAEGLRAAGYAGPFGIDAFRWRGAGGEMLFHPLCELNPRLTFGLVARAITERYGSEPGREGGGVRMLSPGGAR